MVTMQIKGDIPEKKETRGQTTERKGGESAAVSKKLKKGRVREVEKRVVFLDCAPRTDGGPTSAVLGNAQERKKKITQILGGN